jgi:putative endonuclease
MPPGPPYYVYLLSNPVRTVLYVGMTNGLRRRLQEHRTGDADSFTGRYNVKDLVYYERFDTARAAINREKQLKRWRREKKEALIRSENPDMDALSPPIE